MSTARTYYSRYSSPIGELILVGDADRLTQLELPEHHGVPASVAPDWEEARAPFRQVISQLDAYFAGELTEFDLPLAPQGTPFQMRVWDALLTIPYGATASYRDIATQIGQPTAPRAVGLANGRNPIAIIIPCHRVIGTSGALTGYGGGLDRKRWLLDLETGALARRPAEALAIAR